MSQTFGLGAWIQRLPPTQRADTLAVWRTALIVTLAIGLAKHVSFAAGLAGLAAAAAQLMIPLRYALTSDEGDDGIGYGFQGLRRDLPVVLGLLALTLIPFWFLHDLWWTLMGVSDGSGSTLAIPQGEASAWISQHMTLAGQALAALSMVELCAIHLLGVALPEELFYRGYLQPKLCGLFTDRAIGRGFVWNHGIALAAGLFALAHFLGEYNPARLGPFFPALLFGLLRRRSGSIASAVLLHACFNVAGALLFAGMVAR